MSFLSLFQFIGAENSLDLGDAIEIGTWIIIGSFAIEIPLAW